MSHPNKWTVARMIATPIFAIFLLFESIYCKYAALLIFIFASITDWYDGYIARKSGNVTSTGKYLDPLADKLLISTSFGIFTYLGYMKLWMFIIIALRDILITGLRSYALSKGRKFVTSNFAKWKTVCQMAAIYLILIWIITEKSYEGVSELPVAVIFIKDWNVVENLMLLVTFFTAATGLSYLIENRQQLKRAAVAFYRVFVPTNVR
ncbi:MAG: CDP-diacylglycerol--glycerol-3-phosphate 3-phosphatidyltransferase [bacterium]